VVICLQRGANDSHMVQLMPLPRYRLFGVAWRSGNIVGRINEVTLRRARLVRGWVTVFGG